MTEKNISLQLSKYLTATSSLLVAESKTIVPPLLHVWVASNFFHGKMNTKFSMVKIALKIHHSRMMELFNDA